MATPKPGQIRCPTCHQSTPPAAYCTQCGSPVPESARARPRGMDRDELQSRIRARRSGLPAYRRGAQVGETLDYAEPYEPEPEDASVLRSPGRGDHARRDHDAPRFRRGAFVADPSTEDDDAAPAAIAASGASTEGPRWPDEPEGDVYARESDGWPDDVHVDDDYDQYDYAPQEAYAPYEEERRGGAGALAVVGFLAVGLFALIGGAMLWNFMGGPAPVAEATSTPTPTAEATATPAQTAEPTEEPATTPEPDATPIGVFEDGFTARVEPCVGTPDLNAHAQGCGSSGTTNDGALWVWIGFERGTPADEIAMRVLDDGGSEVVRPNSLQLQSIPGCSDRCNGWLYFTVSGPLPAGEYRIEVARNGQPAAETDFTVQS